jgi:hypothetical protein
VTEFVQRGAVPVDRLEIGLRRRHLHIVVCRHVEGAAAADTELACGEHRTRRQERAEPDGSVECQPRELPRR